MKRIKKFNEVDQEITFNSKSLEKDKDFNPTIKTSVEDQEKIEKTITNTVTSFLKKSFL